MWDMNFRFCRISKISFRFTCNANAGKLEDPRFGLTTNWVSWRAIAHLGFCNTVHFLFRQCVMYRSFKSNQRNTQNQKHIILGWMIQTIIWILLKSSALLFIKVSGIYFDPTSKKACWMLSWKRFTFQDCSRYVGFVFQDYFAEAENFMPHVSPYLGQLKLV